MRISVDTIILFSAMVFPRSKPAQALLYVADNHEIVLCDRNITELRDILNRKAPKFLPDAEVLLAEMSYFDTFGPFKLVAGIAKKHPSSKDLKQAAAFIKKLPLESGI